MAGIEVNFPRGGIRVTKRNGFAPAANIVSPFSKKDNKQTAKSRKRKRSLSPDDFESVKESNELFATAADLLTYKKLQEQMLLLGCIRAITPFTLEVELPGKMSGKIKINSISKSFTEQLLKEVDNNDVGEAKDMARLNTMFHVGQFVPIKIIEKIENQNKTAVSLSMDPQVINSDWNHTVFKKGLLVWAAVASRLDHGYHLDAGIPNSRIFLPFDNVEAETTLVVGQPLWCVVQECNVTSTVSTMKTSILEKHLKTATQDDMSFHYLVPGMQFNFTISKHVKFGLQGEFMNQRPGYVNEVFLKSPLDKTSKYRKGQTLKAWLLYVQPTTKLSYFSFRSLESVCAPEYTKGKILRAQIISKTGGGLNIQLPNREKGYVSYRRLPQKFNSSSDAIDKKFPLDSYHQCRILNYIHLEKIYICTFEQATLKEKHFTADDVKIGELVRVKVENITREGLQVSFGHVKGFIQNIHLSNSPYSENIKKHFTRGQIIQARVLSIDERGVYLTHKQALINSDLCLSAYDEAVVNQQYPGVVVNKSRGANGGVLVVFYGDIRGKLLRRHLTEMFEGYTDETFYIGQVITPTVIKVTNDLLHLSMGLPKKTKSKPLQIGDCVNATVIEINKNGLEVEVNSHKIKAFVPTAQLSSSLLLTPLLLQTYKVGDTVGDLLCISSTGKPILSLREAIAYENQNLKIGDIEDLKVGSLIRCSHEESDKNGTYVSAPFTSHSIKFKIPKKELLDKGYDAKLLKLQPQQAIVVKVLKLDANNKISHATAKLSEVFSGDYKYSLELLEQYLQDIEQIQTHFSNLGSPLAEFKLGQRVECEVSEVTDTGCRVFLKDNIYGFASPNHFMKTIKPGQTLTGVVLWVNYVHQYVEVSLNRNVIEKVKEIQDGVIKKSLGSTGHANVLINYPEYVISVLRNKAANGQLIFLPSKLHENAFLQGMPVEELKKIKVLIHNNINGRLIGIDKGHIHALKKAAKRKSKSLKSPPRKSKSQKSPPNKRARLDSSFTDTSYTEDDNESEDSEDDNSDIDDLEIKEEDANVEDEEGNRNGCKEEIDSDIAENNEEENDDSDEDLDDSMEDKEENEVDIDSENEDEEDEVNNCESNSVTSEEEEEEEDEENYQDEKTKHVNVKSENISFDEEDITESESEQTEHAKGKKYNNTTKVKDIKLNGIKNIIVKNLNTESSTKFVSALPGVQNFFSETTKVNFDAEPSSDEEMPEVQTKEKKKKKLTPAERKELARLEEEKLIQKEIENADSTAEPQTAEQFQKLLKGNPNCSKSWIKYISYLISNAEIEKAKSVAQEALQTIEMHSVEERFNVWVCRLNLENNYGDKNSFNDVFNEAVKYNDALSVYLAVIKILADSQKFAEMEEKIQKAKNKFGRLSQKLWVDIGLIYYKNGQLKQARNFKDAGILKLKLKSDQISLIVQFAIMEFQYGEKNQGEALFETFLQHNPKRVDIWTTYIDQVIKKGDVDVARRILERAVSQSIPAKKLKTLFKKFKDFEIQYGNEEQVQHVVELARKYAALA